MGIFQNNFCYCMEYALGSIYPISFCNSVHCTLYSIPLHFSQCAFLWGIAYRSLQYVCSKERFTREIALQSLLAKLPYIFLISPPHSIHHTQSNNFQRGKALSSSLKLKPFADLVWLSALHGCIYQVVQGGGVEILLYICLCLFYCKIQTS